MDSRRVGFPRTQSASDRTRTRHRTRYSFVDLDEVHLDELRLDELRLDELRLDELQRKPHDRVLLNENRRTEKTSIAVEDEYRCDDYE